MKPNFSQHTLRAMILCFLTLASMFCHAQTAEQDPRLKALVPWLAKGEIAVVEVPAAGNALSNMLMVASLKSGAGSQAVERIVFLLRNGSRPTVAVMGQKPSVTEATTLAALKELAKLLVKPATEAPNAETSATLILVGNPEDEEALRDAATAADVRLEVAPIP